MANEQAYETFCEDPNMGHYNDQVVCDSLDQCHWFGGSGAGSGSGGGMGGGGTGCDADTLCYFVDSNGGGGAGGTGTPMPVPVPGGGGLHCWANSPADEPVCEDPSQPHYSDQAACDALTQCHFGVLDFEEMSTGDLMAVTLDKDEVSGMGFTAPAGESLYDDATYAFNANGEIEMTKADGSVVVLEMPMGPTESAIAIAPFASDLVKNMFEFYNPTAPSRFPFGENQDPETKFTPFVDAESRSRNDTSTGFVQKCVYGQEFYVKLGPGDLVAADGTKTAHTGTADFVKLNRVDGVAWSCISSYTDAVPEEVLAMDIVLALEAASNARPPVGNGEKVKVEVTNKAGGAEVHEIVLGGEQGVKNYNAMRMVVEKKQQMVWDGIMGDMEADMMMGMMGDAMGDAMGGMGMDMGGAASAAPGSSTGSSSFSSSGSTTKKAKSCFRGSVMAQTVKPSCFPVCPRVGVTREASTAEATAVAAMPDDELPFVLLNKRINLKTMKHDPNFGAGQGLLNDF
eukprot:g20601.t1